ncbi:MAG: hypothetical protein ACRBN8_10220 [Nannocystales bacterium]
MNERVSSLVLSLALLVGACASEPGGDNDGDAEHASFGGGKADGANVPEPGSPLEAAVLELANTASHATLDDSAANGNVGLDVRAANGIVARRAGPDGVEGTEDDTPFATLAELDAVPYVGPRALGRMVDYVEASGVLTPRIEYGTLDAHGRRRGCDWYASRGYSYCHPYVYLTAHADVEIRHLANGEVELEGACWYEMNHNPDVVVGFRELRGRLDDTGLYREVILSLDEDWERGDWACEFQYDASSDSWTAGYEFNTSYGPSPVARNRLQGEAYGPMVITQE